MSSVKDDLLKAADIIEERGWCQGNWKNGQGQLCILAALETATTERGRPNSLRPAIVAVKARIGIANGSLAQWNDSPFRTKDEVLAALRSAAEVAS